MNACAVLDFADGRELSGAVMGAEIGGRAAGRRRHSDGKQTAARQRARLTKHLRELRMKFEEFETLRARQEALDERVSKLLNAYTRDDLEDEDGRLLLALLTARRLTEDLLVGIMEEAAELEMQRLVSRAKTRGQSPKVR